MRRCCLIHLKNWFRRIRPSREEPKNAVCISNRKKSKCHLSRWVTDSYVDMRIRQPDSSVNRYSNQSLAKLQLRTASRADVLLPPLSVSERRVVGKLFPSSVLSA